MSLLELPELPAKPSLPVPAGPSNVELLDAIRSMSGESASRAMEIMQAVRTALKVPPPPGQKLEGFKVERDADGFMSFLRVVYVKPS